MKGHCEDSGCEEKRTLLHQDGKIYFSKKTERKFFFLLTLIMLLAGIIAKSGLF